MNIESLGVTVETPRVSLPSEQVDKMRQQTKEAPENLVSAEAQKNSQPEELLSQIKSITEDGLYSVQFENDKNTNSLVVKVIDRDTNEVIRQIPPEELLELTKTLNELSGNLVETTA